MSKINIKEKKQYTVNEAKTVENIKYEPMLSQFVLWFYLQGLITGKLEFEK